MPSAEYIHTVGVRIGRLHLSCPSATPVPVNIQSDVLGTAVKTRCVLLHVQCSLHRYTHHAIRQELVAGQSAGFLNKRAEFMSVSASTTYLDFTRWRSEKNPCLKPLVEFLGKETSSGPPSTIHSVDYTQSPASEVQISSLPLEQLLKDVDTSASAAVAQRQDCRPLFRRVVLVEDIDAPTMHTLGTHFDIDPLFFAHYMFTELKDIESSPPPPALGSLPSTFISKASIHLHYQQILNLRRADSETDSTYKFQAQGNVKRSARCTPSISGTQPVILRGCCSAMLKHYDKGWICPSPLP
jgi:hypothetical protein